MNRKESHVADNDNTVLLEDVRIIFRNFAGEERRFNAAGDRNFTVILDEDVALALQDDGWNVKQLKPRGEDEQGDWSLKVSVGYKSRIKPRLVLVTKSKNKRNVLDEDMAEMMDYAEFETVDLIIRPHDWDVNGKTGRKAWLKSMFGTIREDELELKYAYLEDGDMPALPAGQDPNIIEGEIVDEDEDDERMALPRGRS